MSRQSWTTQEDQVISRLVEEFGIDDWTKIAFKLKEYLGTQKRTGKQCRERWYNHLSPSVNKQPWSEEEEELLFKHHKHYGNRWKEISKLFLGRTDNDIKNHFYSTLRRSLRRLNKIVGEKNSTTQMRQIKPSVLSTIMNYIYEQQQVTSSLLESLKNLPILIFEFAKFKPVKLNIKHANINSIKEQTGQIFQLISKFNEEYEQIKLIRRSSKSQTRLKRLALAKSKSYSHNNKIQEQQQIQQFEKVKEEEEQSENYYINIKDQTKQNCFENKISDNENNEKTEFTLHCHYDIHQEFTPIQILNHNIASPKPTSKEFLQPSHPRTFSLEADQIHDMHFNEHEEPSHINMQEPSQFQLDELKFQDKYNEQIQIELIDEVISTGFHR